MLAETIILRDICQGLHNIALNELVCSARVSEVLLYLLTTLLDLGLLKSELENKNKKKNSNLNKVLMKSKNFFQLENRNII